MGTRKVHALGILVLLTTIAMSAAIRIHYTFADPNFDHESAAGILRTDPALLFYITERTVEADGLLPADFRADPRVEAPGVSDLPAMFTVGQELMVAWAYRALDSDLPLHVFAVWIMGIFASLTAVGVYGLAFELTRRVRWAVLAALLWAVMLSNYRTLGFVLIREDFAFPFFALHLYLAFRAARLRTSWAFVWAGLATVAAAATWHAMGFVLLMEAACLLLLLLRNGQNPLAEPGAWKALAAIVASSLLVPVLVSKLFVLSPAMQVALALTLGGLGARRFGWSRARHTAAVLVGLVLLFATARGVAAWSGSGASDFSHVFELLIAKVVNLGQFPEDPASLPFGARLLWQGPFATADPRVILLGMTSGAIALAVALVVDAPGWFTGRGETRRLLLVMFALIALVAAILVERTAPLLGLVSPVLAATLLARWSRTGLATTILAFAVLSQGVYQARVLEHWQSIWYMPAVRNQEQARLMDWIRANVSENEPIVSDYSNSAAILAHTRRPIVQQPKYETRGSRDRIEGFFDAFFQGPVRKVARYMKQHQSRVLVIDRLFLGGNCPTGGVAPRDLASRTRTAAWAFLSNDPDVYRQIPGFKLVYVSPAEVGFNPYRVYVIQ